MLSRLSAALPLAAKEVGLMLRSGYSNAAVMRELSQRHFVGTLSVEDETMLVKAGASAELLAEINNGTYALSDEQNAKAQAAMEEQASRRAAQLEESQKANARYQEQVIAQRAAKTPNESPKANVIADALKGKLVKIDNGNLVPVNDDALATKKLIGLYFSAHWCGPCRKFTPELVDYYNRVITQHPEVEFVFVSHDRSARAMQDYVRETNMPWPALDYASIQNLDVIAKYAGDGIPCLVIVDRDGRVVSDSYEGKRYLGPKKVLTDLDTLFADAAAKRVAGAP